MRFIQLDNSPLQWNRFLQSCTLQPSKFKQNFGIAPYPIRTPIAVRGKQFSIGDMVSHVKAYVSVSQPELAWTAIAIAIYDPKFTPWKSQIGETISLEAIAIELVNRDLGNCCCGGLHDLFALSILLNVDDARPIFSATTRSKISLFLLEYVQQAKRTKQADGGWPADWNSIGRLPARNLVFSKKSTPLSRRLVTCHMIEWVRALPSGFDSFKPSLLDTATSQYIKNEADPMQLNTALENYCPNLHLWAATADLEAIGSSSRQRPAPLHSRTLTVVF